MRSSRNVPKTRIAGDLKTILVTQCMWCSRKKYSDVLCFFSFVDAHTKLDKNKAAVLEPCNFCKVRLSFVLKAWQSWYNADSGFDSTIALLKSTGSWQSGFFHVWSDMASMHSITLMISWSPRNISQVIIYVVIIMFFWDKAKRSTSYGAANPENLWVRAGMTWSLCHLDFRKPYLQMIFTFENYMFPRIRASYRWLGFNDVNVVLLVVVCHTYCSAFGQTRISSQSSFQYCFRIWDIQEVFAVWL